MEVCWRVLTKPHDDNGHASSMRHAGDNRREIRAVAFLCVEPGGVIGCEPERCNIKNLEAAGLDVEKDFFGNTQFNRSRRDEGQCPLER